MNTSNADIKAINSLIKDLYDRKAEVMNKDDNCDRFLRDDADFSTFVDGTFALTQQANKDAKENPEETIISTIGSLYDENKKIVSFKTIFDVFDAVPNDKKTKYAGGITGNDDFNEAIFDWINREKNLNLPHRVVATSGGTGALTLAFNNFLNPGEIILLPRVAWGSYKLMANQYGLEINYYDTVNENNEVDLTNLMLNCLHIIKHQHKLVLVLNDPCQNPTGTSIGYDNWKTFIGFLNQLEEYGSVVLINDVAYIDYAYDGGRKYLELFNYINKNILIMMAISCSKSLTAYGMRLGASILLCQSERELDRVVNAFTRTSRSYWSNVNNGLMETFTIVKNNHYDEFIEELNYYTNLLKERSEIFMEGVKKYDLPVYPYTEGFFITMRIDDDALLDKFHKYLITQHIYTVKFTKGIRLALCSLTKQECARLPELLSRALKVCQL